MQKLNIDKINKLHTDIRKRDKKSFFSIKEENKNEKTQNDFLEINKRKWPEFIYVQNHKIS